MIEVGCVVALVVCMYLKCVLLFVYSCADALWRLGLDIDTLLGLKHGNIRTCKNWTFEIVGLLPGIVVLQ